MASDLTPKRFARMTVEERHRRRIDWFMAEASRQAPNRRMMARCERAYDGDPLDPQKKAAIEARGQVATNHNEVKPIIDWLIGTERRMRIDFNVSPRESLSPESNEDAETKTKLLKWIDDTNRAGFERSYAFDDAVKAGLGWMEVAVRGDSTDIPIYKGTVPWRTMLHDSIGNPRRDLSDCRYIFRSKVVDLDIALAYFPGKEKEILRVRQEGSVSPAFSGLLMSGGNVLDMSMLGGQDETDYGAGVPLDLFNPRERVLLLECWSMEPYWEGRQRKSSSVSDRVEMRMHCSIMTEHATLVEGLSPYKHNRFPFIPLWMYRNKETGLPYGPAKSLLDKQEALNDAMNKARFEMAVNQIIMEKDAYDPELMDVKEIQDEIADPAGIVVLKSGGLAKFETRRGLDNAQAHFLYADRIKTSMQQESSVTAENLGKNSAAESGRAIGLKQDQGSLLTAEIFDNVLLAHQLEGEVTLSAAEQFIVQPMVVSVRGERRQLESIEINKPQADGTYLNDITKRSAQFVVGEQPWRATMAQAAFESMMELMGKLAPVAPQVIVGMLDLIFEYADLPNKESLLQRIRSLTGQAGPDNKMTPEQQQAKQQQAQLAAAEFAAKLAGLQASVREAQAKGQKLEIDAVAKALEGIYMAAQAAQVIGAAPLITPIADELLKSAGFKDQSGSNQPIDPAAVPQQPAPQPPQPGQVPEPQQADGAMQGIETMAPDGVDPQLTGEMQ